MIHPHRIAIEAFVDGTDADSRVADHLRECEFCHAIAEQYRRRAAEVAAFMADPYLDQLAAQLERGIFGAKLIDLKLLSTTSVRAGLLAADSAAPKPPEIQGLATLYSENPEIVMRYMRDRANSVDFLQLIADAPENIAHVLVRAPELDREFLTDASGRAEIGDNLITDPERARWQILLPEATFDLAPLLAAESRPEFLSDTILETARHDRIKITISGRDQSKQIVVELLQIDGKTDFPPVQILLVQDQKSQSSSAAPKQRVLFVLPETSRSVNLRVFTNP